MSIFPLWTQSIHGYFISARELKKFSSFISQLYVLGRFDTDTCIKFRYMNPNSIVKKAVAVRIIIRRKQEFARDI